MSDKFTEETLIADALDAHEGVAEALEKFGLPCYRCAVAEYETILQGAHSKGLDVAEVLSALNALLDDDVGQTDDEENGQESKRNK